MAIIRKVGRWLSVLAVLVVAMASALFLSCCRQVGFPAGADRQQIDKGKGPTTQKSTTRSTVDVRETEKGQPVPRNLLE